MGEAKTRGKERFNNPKGEIYKLNQTGTKYKRNKFERQRKLYTKLKNEHLKKQ